MEFDSLWDQCVGRLATTDPAEVPLECASLVAELAEHPAANARAEATAARFFELLTRDPRLALAEAGLAEALAREAALPILSELVLRRATAQFVLGYGEAAADAIEVELNRLGRSGSSLQRLALLTLRAQALIGSGRLQPALIALEESLAIAERQPRQQALGVVLSAFGNARLHAGHLDSAADYYEQALEHGRTHHQVEAQAINQGNLGLVLHLQGESTRADEAYAEALSLARQANDLRAVSVLEANRGLLATELGDLDLAEGRLEEGLSAARALGDPRREAYCMIRLAAASRLAGAYRTALARLHAAWPALSPEHGGGADLAQAEHHLEAGRLSLPMGEPSEAGQHARLSRSISESLFYPVGVTWGRVLEARALLAEERFEEARQVLEQACAEERELGQPLLRGRILTLQAEVQLGLGELEAAGELLSEARRRLPAETPAAAWVELTRARLEATRAPQVARSLLTHLASDAERQGWAEITEAALRVGAALGT
jgi:tetratricopeptide (TPR) repeat protein